MSQSPPLGLCKMPPYPPQFPELLEEHAYLVQVLSEVAHDSGALEHTCILLDSLRADLRTCTMQVADLERENRASSPKHHDSKVASSASKFYHRVTASIHSDKDKDKHETGEGEKHERLLAAWTRKRTLATEVKNLEIKAQLLRRQNRHHDELQRRLVALYANITESKKPPSREEDEADEDARRAQLRLHEAQRTLDRHKTLTGLLRHGDYALINAGRHLSATDSSESSAVDAAKRCAIQTSVVVDQAKRLEPHFFEQEKGVEVLNAGWLGDILQATSSDKSPISLQSLKPHHTALLSLISRADQQARDHEVAAHRASQRWSDARARRDALKRRVLVKWASSEMENGGERSLAGQGVEIAGVASMRDITSGLENVIPIAVPQRSSATAGLSSSSEQRQRVERDDPMRRASPLAVPESHALQPPSQLPHQKLTPHVTTVPSSAVSSPPKPSSDPRTDGQRGPVEFKPSQPSPAVHRLPSPDPSIRERSVASRQAPSPDSTHQPVSTELATRQRESIIQPSRQVDPSPRYDRQTQLGSGNSQGPSPRLQSEVLSGTGQDDALPHSQPQLPQGQRLPHAAKLSQPALKPSQAIQQNARLPNNSNPNTGARPLPPTSIQSVGSGIAEPREAPPRPLPQSHPTRQDLPQVSMRSSHGDFDSPNTMSSLSNYQVGRHEIQTASGSSRSESNQPQDIVENSASVVKRPSQKQAARGILKQSPVSVTSRPSSAVDADPWGVKVAAATSRPQPKLKTMFNLWRSMDGFKPADPDPSTARVPAQQEPQQPPPPPKANPRAAVQVLRFVDAIEIIPRPAVDSDPYEDEDEEDEEQLPPSPRRGSMIWSQGEEAAMEEGEDEFGGHGYDSEPPPGAGVPINKTLAVDLSQWSASSVSSSHSTEHSSHTKSSSSITPPSSAISASPLLPSYYTTPDDGWIPPTHELHAQKGAGEDKERIRLEGGERIRKEVTALSLLSGAGVGPPQTAPQDHRYAQSAIGRVGEDDGMSHNGLHTRSRDAINMGRFLPPSGQHLEPVNIPNHPFLNHGSSGQTSHRSSKSEHELLHNIFPSPAQSTISERDLLFSP
ncbi:hypothetical protein JB92DRAFT_2905087 [Gautieria morchelliformis]|nr:hypothetical protein JB92DRAFT_2905087 [Gautieria morchelliformis]